MSSVFGVENKSPSLNIQGFHCEVVLPRVNRPLSYMRKHSTMSYGIKIQDFIF
jgi:hypothetical protein